MTKEQILELVDSKPTEMEPEAYKNLREMVKGYIELAYASGFQEGFKQAGNQMVSIQNAILNPLFNRGVQNDKRS